MSHISETLFFDIISFVTSVGDQVESLDRSHIKREIKKDGSLVTSSDFFVHDELCAFLKKNCPHDGILSEEAPYMRGDSDGLWIIDPIDGTLYYAEGNPFYRIMMSRSVRQKFTSGIVYFPAQKILAQSQHHSGTLINGVQKVVSTVETLNNERIYLSQGVKASLPYCGQKNSEDTGFSILKLISGELDGMVIKIVNHKIWDVAPFIALIEHAGGRVTNQCGQDIILEPEEKISFHGSDEPKILVASNSIIHEKLLETITHDA